MPNRVGSPAARVLLLLLLAAVLAGIAGCSEEPTEPVPAGRLPFGVFAVPRGHDPLLDKAYSDIARGGFAWSQMEIDWGATELRFGTYDWIAFDAHMQQSRRTGVPVSLVIRLVDGPVLGPFPEDLRGQGLQSPNVRVRFPAFVRAAVERSRGQVSQLWIGRAVDERLDAHPDDLEAYRVLFALAADSVHAFQPELPVGTSFTYRGTGAPVSLDRLSPHLDQIGWVILPVDEAGAPSSTPEEAVALAAEAVALQAAPMAILTEVGYPRAGGDAEGDAEADRFLAGFHAYLESAPPQLVGVTWFGLYDWEATRASERGRSLHPDDPIAAEATAVWLRSSGLGQVNGVPTALWFRAIEWNQVR